jgi:hypothetical protein
VKSNTPTQKRPPNPQVIIESWRTCTRAARSLVYNETYLRTRIPYLRDLFSQPWHRDFRIFVNVIGTAKEWQDCNTLSDGKAVAETKPDTGCISCSTPRPAGISVWSSIQKIQSMKSRLKNLAFPSRARPFLALASLSRQSILQHLPCSG